PALVSLQLPVLAEPWPPHVGPEAQPPGMKSDWPPAVANSAPAGRDHARAPDAGAGAHEERRAHRPHVERGAEDGQGLAAAVAAGGRPGDDPGPGAGGGD